MIKIENTPDREIWCSISNLEVLNEKIVEEINKKVMALLPGYERLYINLKTVVTIKSEAVSSLRKMMTEFMSMGCSVRYSSVSENLHDIIENLTVSSDG